MTKSPATEVIWCDSRDGRVHRQTPDAKQVLGEEPLSGLQWMSRQMRESKSVDDLWIGYLSYDLGRYFEQLLHQPADPLALPLYVFTRHQGSTKTQTVPEEQKVPGSAFSRFDDLLKPTSNFSALQYSAAVQRILEYISAGDIFQANLSQRFQLSGNWVAEKVYSKLQHRTPGKYAALLDYGSFSLLCNSPELFFDVDSARKIITRPIKGTRPRGTGRDLQLLHSEKDAAELNMIVDLERNDLGKICVTGSIKVSQPRHIEAHPTVFHGVATIEGVLRPNVDWVSLLSAIFPGGSITGAPKIRAMQIIDELESVARGPYCGAIGYIAGDGSMQFNVAIRTIIMQGQSAYVSVGGGIVADSIPADEYLETWVKAQALLEALA